MDGGRSGNDDLTKFTPGGGGGLVYRSRFGVQRCVHPRQGWGFGKGVKQ